MGLVLVLALSSANEEAVDAEASAEQVQEMLTEMDKNGDGKLSETEMLSSLDKDDDTTELQGILDKHFKACDVDGDALLDGAELKEMMRRIMKDTEHLET